MALAVAGLLVSLYPVWIAFLVGILVGWSWKPIWARWSCFQFEPVSSIAQSSPSNGSDLVRSPLSGSSIARNEPGEEQPALSPIISSSSLIKEEEKRAVVTEEDLEHLCLLVERKDGGPFWKHMMDRSTTTMSYQAWLRDLESGSTQYCSRTVYEDATPEILRDFFWDDEFRLKWDNMILRATTVEECPTTGTMVVHWVRKFPFFCGDREYIIGRRIWESGRSYYCVTKGVPCPSIPRDNRLRRVDLYYSSWSIQAVRSREDGDQLTATEVVLFHHEDMGIPRDIAKFGVRQGMWGTVRNIERGLRAYQKYRASGPPLSRSAFMAQINTKIHPDYLKSLENSDGISSSDRNASVSTEKPKVINVPKLVIVGGAFILACSLDKGLLTKTLMFNVARRFGNIGRRACLQT